MTDTRSVPPAPALGSSGSSRGLLNVNHRESEEHCLGGVGNSVGAEEVISGAAGPGQGERGRVRGGI